MGCKITADSAAALKLKDASSLERYDKPTQHIKKETHHFANKGPHSQSYGFSSSHVQIWELEHKEGWVPKNWCFWIVVLEKTLDSSLDFKKIKRVNPKGNQSWIFNDAEWFSSVQLLSSVWLFATPWTTARQASLSTTNSRSLPKPMSIELVIPSNHLILCHLLLLLPSIFPSIRVFSSESALLIREDIEILKFQLQYQSFQWTLRTDVL